MKNGCLRSRSTISWDKLFSSCFQFSGDLPDDDFGKCGEVIVEVASDVHISLSQL